MLLAIFPGVIRSPVKFPHLHRRRLTSINAVRAWIDSIGIAIQ
jgi:hypothetical protein